MQKGKTQKEAKSRFLRCGKANHFHGTKTYKYIGLTLAIL